MSTPVGSSVSTSFIYTYIRSATSTLEVSWFDEYQRSQTKGGEAHGGSESCMSENEMVKETLSETSMGRWWGVG